MAIDSLDLPGTIAIAPSARLTEKMASARIQGDDDLDPGRFVDQLRGMSGTGVPARLETGRDDVTTLRLYTDTHIALLRPTNRGDGYIVTHVSRWSFRDHRSLAAGFLRTRTGPARRHTGSLPGPAGGPGRAVLRPRRLRVPADRASQRRRGPAGSGQR